MNRIFAALLAILALICTADPSAAACKDRPRAGVDWSNCGKTKLLLSGSDLSEANLQSSDLSRSDLTEANLSNAKLVEAELSWTRLSGANLAGADLTKAMMDRTDLQNADLTGAVLAKAEAHRDEARKCYDDGLKAHPGVEGDLTITWVVDPQGKVTKAELNQKRSTITEPTIVNCIVDVIKKIQFAPSPRGVESTYNFPFNFHPRPGK